MEFSRFSSFVFRNSDLPLVSLFTLFAGAPNVGDVVVDGDDVDVAAVLQLSVFLHDELALAGCTLFPTASAPAECQSIQSTCLNMLFVLRGIANTTGTELAPPRIAKSFSTFFTA